MAGSRNSDAIWDRLDGFDRLLEHRTRLGVCVLLAHNDRLSFSRLKELTAESDGALGAHLRKLEENGFLKVRKEFRERKPVTWYELSAAGRRRLEAHLGALQDLIDKDGEVADAGE